MYKATAPAHYFLGANTSEGFTSFYHEFVHPEDGDFLWYIKGGPGNGKSTLMRSVARAAEEQGKHVEYAYCSGDPDSLDGIYIREEHVGYVDATSPHVREPEEPGASGRYLDLSGCYRPGLDARQGEIRELYRKYREQYARSYELLQAAALASPDRVPGLLGSDDSDQVKALAAELAKKMIQPEEKYRAEHRFLSAHTCQGYQSLWKEAAAEQAIVLEDRLGLADCFLQEVRRQCEAMGCHTVLCPDPLRPSRLEGLMVPEQSLLVVTENERSFLPRTGTQRIKLETGKEPDSSVLEEEYQSCRYLQNGLLRQAEESLRKAKELHDQLEALYRPYVDFHAVDGIIREQILLLKPGTVE